MGATTLKKLVLRGAKTISGSISPLIHAPPSLPKDPEALVPTGRKISDYLETVAIKNKGLGTVAVRNIGPCTLLFAESPAAVISHSEGSLSERKQSIAEALRQMTPETKARFYTLHEAIQPHYRELFTREERIWNTNSFNWNRKEDLNQSAICFDMTRINHSCMENAEYHPNLATGKMELYSNRSIRAGQEITISYMDLQLKTAAERKDWSLKRYGFECACPVCATSSRSKKSDERRRLMRQDEDFISSSSDDVFRKTALRRRKIKLMYDEGITGGILWLGMVTYAVCALYDMIEQANRRGTYRYSDRVQKRRILPLMRASMTLLRRSSLKNHDLTPKHQEAVDKFLKANNILVTRELTIAECQKAIHEIMRQEPDPFVERHWHSS